MHLKLYEGYVQATNQLTTQIGEMLKDGRIDHEEMPAYSELTRRLGFEYNGMVLHEHYFENLHKGGATKPDRGSAFVKAAEDSFGTYDMWKLDFSSVGRDARSGLGHVLPGSMQWPTLQSLDQSS